jgi:hypothetical protein
MTKKRVLKRVLPQGTKNASGVKRIDKLKAMNDVLYAGGCFATMDMKDLYPALINRVKEKCNERDWARYASSTNDPAIRKDFERIIGELRKAGYLTPPRKDNTVTLLKVVPLDLKPPRKEKAKRAKKAEKPSRNEEEEGGYGPLPGVEIG